ncbi:MAG: TIGR02266 family protein [Pseudomonadota bacterium]
MHALKAEHPAHTTPASNDSPGQMQLEILKSQLGPANTTQVRTTASERRGEPRFEVEVDVGWNTEHNFYQGLSENLSEGGLFVATYDDLPLGTQLQVTLQLPDAPCITARAVVRWVRAHNRFTRDLAPGVGMQFTALDASAQAAIRSFLSGRAPIFYEPGE